jgi:hypothetical protein
MLLIFVNFFTLTPTILAELHLLDKQARMWMGDLILCYRL